MDLSLKVNEVVTDVDAKSLSNRQWGRSLCLLMSLEQRSSTIHRRVIRPLPIDFSLSLSLLLFVIHSNDMKKTALIIRRRRYSPFDSPSRLID